MEGSPVGWVVLDPPLLDIPIRVPYLIAVPEYRRAVVPGGTFFFTLVTARRRPILTTPAAREALRTALADAARTRPFTIDAIVLLPDHLHCIWTLPPGDADFSTRGLRASAKVRRRRLKPATHVGRGNAHFPKTRNERRIGGGMELFSRFRRHGSLLDHDGNSTSIHRILSISHNGSR